MGDEDEIWPGNQYDHQNFLLAQAIHRAAVLSKSNAPSDRGVKRARFKVLRLARSPSVLVEGGFMSSPRESSLLKTEAYRQQVAEWIFEGILAYQRSQERPEDGVRLKLATASGPETRSIAGTNRSILKLEEVPNFRPKTNSSPTAVAISSNVSPGGRNNDVAGAELRGSRAGTNNPISTVVNSTSPSGLPHANSPGTAVLKAEPAEPEVRRAIPVTPRKGE